MKHIINHSGNTPEGLDNFLPFLHWLSGTDFYNFMCYLEFSILSHFYFMWWGSISSWTHHTEFLGNHHPLIKPSYKVIAAILQALSTVHLSSSLFQALPEWQSPSFLSLVSDTLRSWLLASHQPHCDNLLLQAKLQHQSCKFWWDGFPLWNRLHLYRVQSLFESNGVEWFPRPVLHNVETASSDAQTWPHFHPELFLGPQTCQYMSALQLL